MPRQVCGSCGVEKCPDCGHIWNDDPDDECDCRVVDTRNYAANPLTESEILTRKFYSKRFMDEAMSRLRVLPSA